MDPSLIKTQTLERAAKQVSIAKVLKLPLNMVHGVDWLSVCYPGKRVIDRPGLRAKKITLQVNLPPGSTLQVW